MVSERKAMPLVQPGRSRIRYEGSLKAGPLEAKHSALSMEQRG